MRDSTIHGTCILGKIRLAEGCIWNECLKNLENLKLLEFEFASLLAVGFAASFS